MKEIRFKKSDTVKVIAELASYIDSLKDDKEYIMTIKEHKEKRSLSANNYFWKMVDDLAEKLHIAKTDIYRSYVKEIGGNNDVGKSLCKLGFHVAHQFTSFFVFFLK